MKGRGRMQTEGRGEKQGGERKIGREGIRKEGR